ncbi:NAD(P)H-binding protein [Nocardia sp. NPDC050406]|uniref:NAD(P)H-binding protein n=1 Tax=Nocardia sp. NPDC050406 TaxID=3364318 RepID=UPI0037B19B25
MAKIVIFGGYGAVGREAARELVVSGRKVVLAGRNPDRAKAIPGAEMVRVDTTDPEQVRSALADASAVLMCTESQNAEVARASFERGIHYLDVTASYPVICALEALHESAVANNAVGVLSVGLIPGVSNLLARSVFERSSADEVGIGAVLGSGETHGPAAIRWTLDGLGSLPGSWAMDFPTGRRSVHRFPFSDQYTLPRTLGASQVRTGLAMDSRLLTALLAAARLPGLAKVMRSRAAAAALGRIHVGSDRFALKAESGTAGAWFTGRRQSRATGVVAAMLVERLDRFPAGVRHIEELVDPDEFLSSLNAYGFESGNVSGPRSV